MSFNDNNLALRKLSTLVDFSNQINSSLDVNFTLSNLILTCFAKFNATKGLVFLLDKNEQFSLKISKGIDKRILNDIPEFDKNNYQQNENLKLFLNSYKFPILQKIISTNGLIGILLLGQKLNKKPYSEDDKDFLATLVNIATTAIENSLIVEKLKTTNRKLDTKVNQLSSLFDLSKEFSGILKIEMISKLLTFSIIGQLLVSKYAVVTYQDNTINVLNSKIDEENLKSAINNCKILSSGQVLLQDEIIKNYKPVADLGIELVIPMKIKNETKGLILLGKRGNDNSYLQSDIEYISSIGSLAIISIENLHLFEETLEKQKIEKDLETAKNIQQSLLPGHIPSSKHFEIAAYSKPAKQVGGDYYDLIKLDSDRILMAIGDVSGKGVQAALLMANLQAFLKSIVKQNIPLPEASNLINDLVSDNTTLGNFITFFWGILNDITKELTYVNAGHNPPYLIRDKKIINLKTGGMLLGVMQTIIPYKSESIKLNTGDIIILFTDGITEAMNDKNDEYSNKRLENLIIKLHDKSAGQILDNLIKDVKRFTGNAEQSDDITIVVIKVK